MSVGSMHADVGIIGGTGLYEMFDDAEHVDIATPWGEPSDAISIGTISGRQVAFVARHGSSHQLPPHRINYRANLWALHHLGVRQVVAPCASGSLRADIAPGTFVICDQLIDHTSGRDTTFFDGPTTHHISFAEPYCSGLRAAATNAVRRNGIQVHEHGTVAVINGPRFSTRAESRWHAATGASLINMTQAPEAPLARELGLCYAAIALITDWDAGLDDDPSIEPVNERDVYAILASNADKVRNVLRDLIADLPDAAECGCGADSIPVPQLMAP